ncbi:hypothetical protein D9Q98_009672 [Chlorella vulgaris]|uniref:Transmembrane protein n=1 Tax=Chlorella vulgaris TaxID=3077 RepID=A0A9D4TEU5_CHLVU|nr:hypothetical protein D9Q98_009672 [Chlorella vulgaris]
MYASSGALQVGGRRLLSDCTVVGSVGVGGSIAILLLIGFVLGGASSWLFFWWRQRRAVRIELEYRQRYGDFATNGLPDVNAMVKAAHTPTIARGPGSELTPLGSQPKAAPGMSDGPLAMGAASSFKQQDSLAQTYAHKEQHHSNPVAGSVARSSSGNPFSGEVPSFNVRRNDVCSLNNTPRSSYNGPLAGGAQPTGLIAAGMFAQATDPDSPRMGVPVAPAQPNSTHPADDASGCTGEEAQAASAEHSVQPGGESFVVKIPAAGGGGSAGGGAGGGGGDYLAALHSTGTNPFETSALRQEDEEQPLRGASAKATQKLEMLQQVQDEEYGEEDLDPEWASLLADLDARLQAVGQPSLDTRERAVAIRSLIVATASQSADVALNKAQHDIIAFRRAHTLRKTAA